VKHKRIDLLPMNPLMYRHPLFWFLANIDRMSDKIAILDQAAGILLSSDIPNVRSRLHQLVDDDQTWWSHVGETYLAAWLIQNGFSLSMDKAGPDYVINHPDGSMFVEFTSLTRGNWIDRLIERAGVLADRYAVDLTVWYRLRRSTANNPGQQWKLIEAVVEVIVKVGRPAMLIRRHIEVRGHEIYVDISPAENEPKLFAVGPESVDLGVPQRRLSETIERKMLKRQIADGRASYLVVDVSGIEGSHQWFIQEPDRLELTIPMAREHLRGLYLYWSSLDRLAPFACIKYLNAQMDDGELPVVAQFDKFVCSKRQPYPPGHPEKPEMEAILRRLGPQPWTIDLPALVVHGRFESYG